MANKLDEITLKSGRKYGIYNKGQLITTLLADSIENYEETKNITRSTRRANLGNEVNVSSKTQKLQTRLENVVKLYDLIGKHADEKPCKHSFLEVLREIREI